MLPFSKLCKITVVGALGLSSVAPLAQASPPKKHHAVKHHRKVVKHPRVSRLAPGSRIIKGGPEAAAALNAIRVENGLPANLVENPEWSYGCQLHIKYELANTFQPGMNFHSEIPGKPYYTDAGKKAAESSELGGGTSGVWGYHANPWLEGPFHNEELLSPLSGPEFGYAPGCMGVRGHIKEWPANAIFSYPGAGSVGVPTTTNSQGESDGQGYPYSPALEAGLHYTTTGFNIFLWSPGTFYPQPFQIPGPIPGTTQTVRDGRPGSALANVKVTEASGGPVNVLAVNGALNSWVIIVPVQPLKPFTTYRVQADWNNQRWGNDPQHQDFSFTTGKAGTKYTR